MRCNCVPKENKNRCGRRATQQVFCSVPEVRSGSSKLRFIAISSEPLQNLWFWLCSCCSTSLLKPHLNRNLQRRLTPIPCCFIDLMISQITLCQLPALLNLLSSTLKNSFVNTATVKQVGQSFIVATNIYYALLLISSTIENL